MSKIEQAYWVLVLVVILFLMGGFVYALVDNTHMATEGTAYQTEVINAIGKVVAEEMLEDKPNAQAIKLLNTLQNDIKTISAFEFGKAKRAHKEGN